MNSEPLFNWMHSRHELFLNKLRGVRPWTDDLILAKHKFTNVYRELDRQTAWLRKNVTDGEEHREVLLLNCTLFRWIGRCDPFVASFIRFFTFEDLRDDYTFHRALAGVSYGVQRALRDGCPTYTDAYTIHGDTGKPRIEFIVKMLKAVYLNRVSIVSTHRTFSVEATFNSMFNKLPGFGGNGFMAYEIVTDLRHTQFYDMTPEDIMTWCNSGPGSMRGLNRLCDRPLKERWRRDEFLCHCQALLHAASTVWKWKPVLELRDIEHSLCEFDKYERIRLGEGRGRRYIAT